MFLTYCILCWLGSAFFFAYKWDWITEDGADEEGAMPVAIGVTVFSPLIIAIAVVLSPLAAPIGLGVWMRRRKRAKLENK